MSIKKKYLRSGGVCKVTFNLPPSIAQTARTANVVGEFNNWDQSKHPMKKSKSGNFSLSLDLEKNREYEFRYLIDDTNWETDWDADSVAPIPWGDEFNSVVKV